MLIGTIGGIIILVVWAVAILLGIGIGILLIRAAIKAARQRR